MTKTPQVGDVVHVRGTVALNGGAAFVDVRFDGGDILSVQPSSIVHIEPAPLKVGDRVYNRFESDPHNEATIVAIDGELAWLRYKLSDWIAEIGNLERLP